MEKAVIIMCLFVACSAAPVQKRQSDEIAAHANEALRLMEMYRLLQQQGIVPNPFLPAAEIPGTEATPEVRPEGPARATPEQVDFVPAQAATIVPPPPVAADAAAAQPVGDESEEQEDAKPASKAAAAPVAPPNSEEADEETEEVGEATVIKAEAAEAPAADPVAPADVPAVDAAPKAPRAAEAAVGEVPAEAAAFNTAAASPLADTTVV
ncbi:enamelin isoform X1 [Corythoichthys intestinalis]|uniref:enamelin isoform X1 n=1 Tax=Corythoichthys intestinalis TaxID=161448 RepID=UPI0025A522F4|nr:enamelin isoform X1 [Corythoichthys intestinalis]